MLRRLVVRRRFVARLVGTHEEGTSGDADQRREDGGRPRAVPAAIARVRQPRRDVGQRIAGLWRLWRGGCGDTRLRLWWVSGGRDDKERAIDCFRYAHRRSTGLL